MTPEAIFNLLTSGVGPLIKVLFLIVILLYGVFAVVVARQVQIMNKVVEEISFAPILLAVAITHVALVFALFVVAIFVL